MRQITALVPALETLHRVLAIRRRRPAVFAGHEFAHTRIVWRHAGLVLPAALCYSCGRMSWVTIIWSMIAAVSATLATIYLLIWFRERRSWAYLCFFVLAVGVIGMAASEFAAMHAKSPTEYGAAVRWGHFANGLMAVGALGFVHFYFGTGKGWLLGAALGLRLLAVVMNFCTGLNLHIGSIQSLQQVNFLGEPVSMLGVWTLNPWVRLGQFAALVQVIYVVDASLRLWRTSARESRRRAVMVGGTLAFFTLFSSAQAGLVAQGVLRMPIIVSFPFLAVLLAMSWELSLDARRAAQLGRDLRESEQQMAMATEAANLGVWVRDLTRNTILASDRWRLLFGFTPAERLDLEKFLQRLHPDDREIFRQAVAKATNGDGRYEAEFRVMLPDGGMRWVISRGQVEFNSGGKAVRVRGVSVDITERKRTEEASRNANELTAAIFNSVPGLLYLYTEDGRLIRWNRQHEVMTGYSAEELLNFRIEEWFDEENRLKLAQEFPKIFSEGYTQVEMSLILKNKQKMSVFATGSKLILDGKPHMVGIAVDISARKRTEEELAQHRTELSHLSRVATMSELSSSLAHELNQPLAIILTNAQAAQRLLAQNPPDVAETREILADIVNEDYRAGEVIRRLRAHLKPGQTQRRPLSVNEIIEEVLRIGRSDLIGRGVTVHTALAESAPQVLGDRIQLQQVLLNLILNASDAMAGNPPAQRHLTIATAHRDGWVRISVSDNGCGLPAEPERIFQPFYTTKKDGLGLGLPICRSIATAHQGRLWAESNELAESSPASPRAGKGTTLHLELPAETEPNP